MPAATLPAPTTNDALPRKQFTRAEVERMMDLGLFAGQRCELIDGDLIDKMGQKPPHSTGIQKIANLLAAVFGIHRLRIQLPIEASTADRERSMPEPDLAVLKAASVDYEQRHPNGDELLLVVEVSDTTAQYDSTTKRDLYARAGVPEYWVLDVRRRVLRIHRRLSNGQYKEIAEIAETEIARTESLPEVEIQVADLLPKKR